MAKKEILVGRTDTLACKFLVGSYSVMYLGYVLLLISWLKGVGVVIGVVLSLVMWKLPYVRAIEPLNEKDERDFWKKQLEFHQKMGWTEE